MSFIVGIAVRTFRTCTKIYENDSARNANCFFFFFLYPTASTRQIILEIQFLQMIFVFFVFF